jgi:DNA-directed RNA polymerase specialized sigma24 family protein
VKFWGSQGAQSEIDLEEGLAVAIRDVAHRWLSESPGDQGNPPLLNIWDAVNRLPSADLHRLLNFARFRIRELGRKALGRDARDLLSEAITATANGQRTWSQGIDIRQHLYGAIRSISNRWYEKKGEEILESDLVQPGDLSPLDQAATVLDPERILQAKERLDQIRNLFAKDSEAMKVVDLFGEGWKPKEIQEHLDIEAKKFDAIAKRIRLNLAARGHI